MKIFAYISILLVCTSLRLTGQVSAYFAADTTFGCGSLIVNFSDTSSGSGITSWEWDFNNDGITDSNVQNPVSPAYGPGTYSVKLTVSNGVDTDVLVKTNYITVRELPVPKYGFDTTYHFNNSLAVLFTDSSTYNPSYDYITSWNFGDGTELETDSLQILHIFKEQDSFRVYLTLTDEMGCTANTSKVIYVESALLVPNVFTPNGDGINDIFTVVTDGQTVYEFVVYSRWGMILFKSVGTQIMWDGRTSAGEKLNTATYYYTITSLSPENPKAVHGSLQLSVTRQ